MHTYNSFPGGSLGTSENEKNPRLAPGAIFLFSHNLWLTTRGTPLATLVRHVEAEVDAVDKDFVLAALEQTQVWQVPTDRL